MNNYSEKDVPHIT